MHKPLFALSVIVLVLLANPAAASAGVQVPESSALGLFALGLLGVLIGRRGVTQARKKEQDKADRDD